VPTLPVNCWPASSLSVTPSGDTAGGGVTTAAPMKVSTTVGVATSAVLVPTGETGANRVVLTRSTPESA